MTGDHRFFVHDYKFAGNKNSICFTYGQTTDLTLKYFPLMFTKYIAL